MTLKEIKEKINAGSISQKDGIITVRFGYFYRMERSAKKYAEKIKEIFPSATIIEKGDHSTSFRGGASLANSSHFYVKFTI